jgi:hypothetical protein
VEGGVEGDWVACLFVAEEGRGDGGEVDFDELHFDAFNVFGLI